MAATLLSSASKWLLPIILEAGAGQLKSMIESGIAGEIVGGLVEQIAGKLGVAPTQKDIEDAYAADPKDVIEAVQQVDQHYDLVEQARSASMISQHQVQIAELQGGLLARVGRPLNTIFFAFECLALMLAVCLVVLRGIPANLDFSQVAPLLALVVPVLTAQAGVIGWDARQQRLTSRDAG